MAADDKTEAPTSKRLSDARTEGNVPMSQEVNTAAALLIGAWLLQALGPQIIDNLRSILVTYLSQVPPAEITIEWLRDRVLADAMLLTPSVLGVVGILLLGSVAITFAQSRFLIAPKRLKPNFGKLNPLNGIKRYFSTQGLVEMLKALLKLSLVGWVVYTYLSENASLLLGLANTDLISGMVVWAGMADELIMNVATAYLLMAAVDFGYQRWQYNRNLRMSKEEVKEEVKQREGDPLIRSRIRGAQRRMARMRMMSRVPKADVIITNPTHLALAVQYNADDMGAPRLLAKGADKVAERIVAIARQHNIPVVQNIPLARAMYRTVEIDQEIPPDLYMAMAEVLAYVYRIRGKTARPATAN